MVPVSCPQHSSNKGLCRGSSQAATISKLSRLGRRFVRVQKGTLLFIIRFKTLRISGSFLCRVSFWDVKASFERLRGPLAGWAYLNPESPTFLRTRIRKS